MSSQGRTVDLGAGLWWARPVERWDLVRVLHREEDDRFFFAPVHDQHIYGVDMPVKAGYGRRELAFLYLSETLSLCPERLQEEGHDVEPAVIRNKFGDPVLADWDPVDGVGSLVVDPTFYAVGLDGEPLL